MPARARKEIVDPKSPGYYMVTQRVVRGLRLTGVDPYTGRDYTYRQRKLERRIRELSGLYLIEIAEFNCGEDGFDLLVRTRPDLAPSMADEEVVRRMLRRSEKQLELKPVPSAELVAEVAADPKRLAKLRARIANLSQFMGDVDEAMARDVNRESDGARRDIALGRLWQGRFNSVRVLDPPALLLAATHIEAKKVVDGEAATLETARCCSAELRASSFLPAVRDDSSRGGTSAAVIDSGMNSGMNSGVDSTCEVKPFEMERAIEPGGAGRPHGFDADDADADDADAKQKDVSTAPDAWLLPMSVSMRSDASAAVRQFESESYLGVSYEEFQRLLKWTLEQTSALNEGRKGGGQREATEVRSPPESSSPRGSSCPSEGVRANLPAELVALFARFRLRVDVWIEAVLNFRVWYRTAIGLGDALKSFARRLGVAWLAGQGRRRHPFAA